MIPDGCTQPTASGRPQRHRIAPLQFWRNEKQVFTRKPGALVATMSGVVKNLAPQWNPSAPNASHSLNKNAEAPLYTKYAPLGSKSCRTCTLKLSSGAKMPVEVGSNGILHLLEGCLLVTCWRLDADPEEEPTFLHQLNAGDTFLLEDSWRFSLKAMFENCRFVQIFVPRKA